MLVKNVSRPLEKISFRILLVIMIIIFSPVRRIRYLTRKIFQYGDTR